jgi:outer membrane protein OmpA-like peptidoglycan-associated protein
MSRNNNSIRIKKGCIMQKRFAISVLAAAVAVSTSGCADMNEVQRGTATGAAVGGGLGTIWGAATGDGGGHRTATGAIVGSAAGAVIGNIWSARMEKQKREMQQAAQGTGIKVSQTPDNRLKIDIPSDISFDTNRADIKPNFRSVLDKFAQTMAEHPDTTVNIVGHTDSTGSDAVNEPLSINRAASTREYLTEHGVAMNRIHIDGHGSHEPLASNDTPTGRAQNRRVEIYVAEPQVASGPQQPAQPQQPYSTGR